MDGVLAEVTESYRESIVQTVRSFTGKTVTRDAIQDYKNQGGWNNDWALSQKIAADFGIQIDYDTVIEKFNEYFLGENGNGLVTRESWFPQPGLLGRLVERYGLSLFTGRLRYEADITLRRFAPCVKFDPMICADDVTASKPAPEGLLTIERITKETQIHGSLTIDGQGTYQISTGVRFFDHMLELFAKHGGFDLKLRATGDLDVDQHHTVEDVGIVLGQLFAKALGDRKGINRAGYFVLPMDETLAVVAVGFGGGPAAGG